MTEKFGNQLTKMFRTCESNYEADNQKLEMTPET